jgi:hypothetical protein
MDLNTILGQLTGLGQQRVQAANTLQQSHEADTARIQNLLTLSEQEAGAVVQRSTVNAQAEAQLAYTIGKAKEANAALAGMNPADLNNEYVRSIADFTSADEQRKALEAQRTAEMRRIEQLSSANLLENPLAYIAAQLQLPAAAARHNSMLNQEIEATQRRDSAAQNISARAQLIREKDSIIAANTADTLLGINTEKAKIAELQASAQLRQAQAANISTIGARAMESYRIAGDKFSVQSDLFNKQISVEQWKAQQAANAEARAARAEAAMDRLNAKKEEDAETAQVNARLAAASHMLGYEDPFTLRTMKILPREQQEALIKTAFDGKLGNGLAQSINVVSSLGRTQAMAATNPGLGKFVSRADQGLRSYIATEERKATSQGKKFGAEDAAAAAAQYQYDLEASSHNIGSAHALNSARWDGTGAFNPYKPEYLALVNGAESGAIPQLANNRLVPIIKVLQGQLGPTADNLRGQDMENMVKVLAKQVADGKAGVDDAAQDFVRFHQVAAAKNKDFYNYTQFGLRPQDSAIITVPAVTSFGDPYQFDAMNAAQTKSELARMAREIRMGTLGMIGTKEFPINFGATAPAFEILRRSTGVGQ